MLVTIIIIIGKEMSVAFFNADRLSNVNNESHAEVNIYFPPHFRTVTSRTTNQVTQQNSGDVTSVNNCRIQERDMVKIIDEKVEKKVKKLQCHWLSLDR